MQSLCSKWHSSPVFITNIEGCQDWSWQCRCGDQPGQEHCWAKWNPNVIQSPGQGKRLHSGSLIMLLTLGMCSRPCGNPWHWSTCCEPFAWVKASKAARWFLRVSSICTACSQSPKWGRGTASRSVSKQSHTSTIICREDVVSYLPLFLDLNIGLCTCVIQWESNGLFWNFIPGHYFLTRIIKKLSARHPKASSYSFIACFLGNITHHAVSVKNIFKFFLYHAGNSMKNSLWIHTAAQWSTSLHFVIQTRSSPHYLTLYKHIKKQSRT